MQVKIFWDYIFFFSLLIYITETWIFSSDRGSGMYAFSAAFSGAFLFILLTTKMMLGKYIFKSAFIGGILSIIGFVATLLLPSQARELGFALPCIPWTFFVGLIIDISLSSHIKSLTESNFD